MSAVLERLKAQALTANRKIPRRPSPALGMLKSSGVFPISKQAKRRAYQQTRYMLKFAP